MSNNDAWSVLTAHSGISEGDAWEHMNNLQQGGLVVQGLEAHVNTDSVVALYEEGIAATVVNDPIVATVDLEGMAYDG